MNIIHRYFAKAYEADKAKYIDGSPFLVDWSLQRQMKEDGIDNNPVMPDDFFDFKGTGDLKKWMDWCNYQDVPCCFLVEGIPELSMGMDKEITKELGIEFNFHNYCKRIGMSNAIDFYYPTYYGSTPRPISRVLDFGAGYGRQAALWSTGSDTIYVGMDGIVNSYCAQSLYYSAMNNPLSDYILSRDAFHISDLPNMIYHLPTWRNDLLPDKFFDMVMCVQVLRELSNELVVTMLSVFKRVLKTGGIIYIRDHEERWLPACDLNIDNLLTELGFEKEEPTNPAIKKNLVDGVDCHGIPRVWRKK